MGAKFKIVKRKTLILLTTAVLLFAWQTEAQTNQLSEIHRIDNGEIENNLRCEIVRVYPKYLAVSIQDDSYHRTITYSETEGIDERTEDGKILIIENYPDLDQAAQGQMVSLKIKRVGTIKSLPPENKVFELWHYITPQEEEEAFEKREAVIEKERLEAQKGEQARISLSLKKSFNTVFSMATNGDAGMQYSLGIRYLNGQGCETNHEQAIYWLTQSANQGNLGASNKLLQLKSP